MNLLRLKEILKEKSITGRELAEKIGVSQPAVSDIANGKSFPRPELLLQIADALNVDVKDLFYSTKDKQIIHLIVNNKLHTFTRGSELKKFVDDFFA